MTTNIPQSYLLFLALYTFNWMAKCLWRVTPLVPVSTACTTTTSSLKLASFGSHKGSGITQSTDSKKILSYNITFISTNQTRQDISKPNSNKVLLSVTVRYTWCWAKVSVRFTGLAGTYNRTPTLEITLLVLLSETCQNSDFSIDVDVQKDNIQGSRHYNDAAQRITTGERYLARWPSSVPLVLSEPADQRSSVHHQPWECVHGHQLSHAGHRPSRQRYQILS